MSARRPAGNSFPAPARAGFPAAAEGGLFLRAGKGRCRRTRAAHSAKKSCAARRKRLTFARVCFIVNVIGKCDDEDRRTGRRCPERAARRLQGRPNGASGIPFRAFAPNPRGGSRGGRAPRVKRKRGGSSPANIGGTARFAPCDSLSRGVFILEYAPVCRAFRSGRGKARAKSQKIQRKIIRKE